MPPPAVASPPLAEALHMIELFSSVGADSFDVTHTNLRQEKRGFRQAQTVAQIQKSLPYLIPSSARRQNNVIVRPRSTSGSLAFVQLDDLNALNLARIAPFAFLTLETSAKGCQAWLAVKNPPAGFQGRLKEGLGADLEASGATRLAGTLNYKPKYAPDFPRVRIVLEQIGRVLQPEVLEAAGVVAPAKPELALRPDKGLDAPRTHKWPDYQRCLDGAPQGTSGNPKRTLADFVWCKISSSWGHSIDATVERLLLVSTKAQENGRAYAQQTAEHAEYAARVRNAKARD